MKIPIAIVGLVLLSFLPLQGQELRTFAISVQDKDGKSVNSLTKDNFQVFEDRIPQQISSFLKEDVPLSIGLVIDNSGSMRTKRLRVNGAALSFVRESNPEDQTFIVNFNDTAKVEQDFTGSIGNLIDALDKLDTRGETALYDAVYLSAEKVKSGRNAHKALLVISDGDDTSSKHKYDEVLKLLKESFITVYAIGLIDERTSRKAREALQEFAAITGGAAYFPKSLDEIDDLCKRIARDLRNRYMIGYKSANPKTDGSWRDVTVVVTQPKSPKLTWRNKPGYFATAK